MVAFRIRVITSNTRFREKVSISSPGRQMPRKACSLQAIAFFAATLPGRMVAALLKSTISCRQRAAKGPISTRAWTRMDLTQAARGLGPGREVTSPF